MKSPRAKPSPTACCCRHGRTARRADHRTPRQAHRRTQPGHTHRGGARFPCLRPCPDGAQDGRWPGAVRGSMAGHTDPGHHGQPAAGHRARTRAVQRRSGLHPRCAGPPPPPPFPPSPAATTPTARSPTLPHVRATTTLEESARYLTRAPKTGDIRSIRVALRPLVKPQDDEGDNTKSLGREHAVLASRSGLVTVAGTSGAPTVQWPRMCCKNASLRGCCRKSPQGRPTTCPWWARPRGRGGGEHRISQAQGLHSYGSDAAMVQGLPGADIDLGGGLSAATVRFAACHGYACTVEDMLARRSRLLFLDARQAIEPAPAVAHSCCARNWAPIRGSTRSWPSRNGICMPPPNFALDFSKALCQNRWLRSKERNFCPAGSAANGLRRGRRAQDWLADLPPLRGSRGLLSFGASWEH